MLGCLSIVSYLEYASQDGGLIPEAGKEKYNYKSLLEQALNVMMVRRRYSGLIRNGWSGIAA